MDIKKSKKADLESWRSIFLTIGLAISLGTLLLAFEWKSPTTNQDDFSFGSPIFDVDIIPITQKPKPKIKIPKHILADKFELAKNDRKDIRDEVIVPDYFDPDTYFDSLPDEKWEMVVEPWYEFPQFEPKFPGNINQFLKENVHYPEMSTQLCEEGTVYISFVVGANGKVRDIKIIRGVSDRLDEESIRVIKKMPLWTPAKQGDRKVSTTLTLPIKFTLRN